MTLSNYMETVHYKEYDEIKNSTLKEIILYMHQDNILTFYIVKNKKPFYIITSKDIIDIFLNDLLNLCIQDYIKKYPKDIKKIHEKTNILDAYCLIRKNNIKQIPVVNENDELIGEITFKNLSLKIADIAIKDRLTGLFNKKYFDVLIEELNEFNKPLGLIFIELQNINILENFYDHEIINELIKYCAKIIKSCVRDVDFVFRNQNLYKILTFNDLEVTEKIVKRIISKLENSSYKNIDISFKISFSHVPEIEDNILAAIERCEEKLIERD